MLPLLLLSSAGLWRLPCWESAEKICQCLAFLKARFLAEPTCRSAYCSALLTGAPLYSSFTLYLSSPADQKWPVCHSIDFFFIIIIFYLIIFPSQDCRHSVAWRWLLTVLWRLCKVVCLQSQPIWGESWAPALQGCTSVPSLKGESINGKW